MAQQKRKTQVQKPVQQVTKPIETPGNKKRYWFGNIHIRGVGIVNGEVREDHLAKFMAQHKRGIENNGLADRDQKPLNIDYYIRDTDILGEAKAKHEAARKKKLGFN